MSASPAASIEPHLIACPSILSAVIDQIVDAVSRRRGMPPEKVRRDVEEAVLRLGVAAVQANEGARP